MMSPSHCTQLSWVKWENSGSAVFSKLSRTLQHKTSLVSWRERVQRSLPWPVPHPARGTRCSAVGFASCPWRPSRNDTGWCNAVWWSSPPIPSWISHYLSRFIQCVARMSNQKLLVQSCCDVLELVPLRTFCFVCLKWRRFEKKKLRKELRTHNEPKPHPLMCSQAGLKGGCIVSYLNFEFTGRFKQHFHWWMNKGLLSSTDRLPWLCITCLQTTPAFWAGHWSI